MPREPWEDASLRTQPPPHAAVRTIATGVQGSALDHHRLRSQYGSRLRQAAKEVERTLSGSRPGRRYGTRAGARTDLAAVRLYLAEEWAWLDPTILEGGQGAHLPLARCIGAGLRGLPSHHGPAVIRTNIPPAVVDWYRRNKAVADLGFLCAEGAPATLNHCAPGYLVWSLSGRLTTVVDPYEAGRVVFLPGTRFKVLDIVPGRHPTVMMREKDPHESDAARSDSEMLDKKALAELTQVTLAAAPTGSGRVASRGPRGRHPGLIVSY